MRRKLIVWYYSKKEPYKSRRRLRGIKWLSAGYPVGGLMKVGNNVALITETLRAYAKKI